MTKHLKAETPEDALNACLDKLEQNSTLKLAKGAREAAFDGTIGKFRDSENQKEWPTFRTRVLHASALAGKLADLLARFRAEEGQTQPDEVAVEELMLSLKLVKSVCDARRGAGPRFRWCPD